MTLLSIDFIAAHQQVLLRIDISLKTANGLRMIPEHGGPGGFISMLSKLQDVC